MDDAMAIWFFQEIGNEIHWIDYYENSGEGLGHYIGYLKSKPYMGNYGQHWAPHDIKVRELGTGKSRWETALRMGIRFEICPKLQVMDGIDATRQVLMISYFDEEKCSVGFDHLQQYTKEYDDKKGVYRNKPKHDEHCHAADAIRTGCVAFRHVGLRGNAKRQASYAKTEYDMFDF